MLLSFCMPILNRCSERSLHVSAMRGSSAQSFVTLWNRAYPGKMSCMDPLTGICSWLGSRWRLGAVIACGLAVASVYKLSTETEEQRAQRAKQKRENEITRVAKQISNYARDLHRRYPDGEVVISDADLAKQLHKPHELVASALDNLSEQKTVQRASLAGYWKLNV